MPLRLLLLCPGRGSYLKEDLRSLAGVDGPALRAFEAHRTHRGLPSLRELDSRERFEPAVHLAGEHASGLTAAISLSDLEQLHPDKARLVGVCGNSMGWYTALIASGALPLEDGVELIETMGGWQAPGAHGVVGGQLVYPLTGDDWRIDQEKASAVARLLAEVPDLFWSIHLGGQAVLGGSEAALAEASRRLSVIEQGGLRFPLRLPYHSAFHTPLMGATAARARTELGHLRFRPPALPLIDGRGRLHHPHLATGEELRDWTLGPQVEEAYDFTSMLRVALGELAPDAVLLPGPNSKLGGAVAQVMIAMGWQGLRCKDDFIDRQRGARPVLLAMRWADQRALVVA